MDLLRLDHALPSELGAQRSLLPDVIDLGTVAQGIYRARELRSRFFPRELFGEPCWDMLLDLYAAQQRGNAVSVSSCCIASGVPSTTALRYLHRLESAGLIERCKDGQDGRRYFLQLTTFGLERMTAALLELGRLG